MFFKTKRNNQCFKSYYQNNILTDRQMLDLYFRYRQKYDPIKLSNSKMQMLIQEGKLHIQDEKPILLKQQSSKLAELSLRSENIKRMSIRLKTHQISPVKRQFKHISKLSIKNRRMLESLLLKYNNFIASIIKLKGQETKQIKESVYTKISQYEEILQYSLNRMPTSNNEEEFLSKSSFNIHISYSMSNDIYELKKWAKKFNCFLYRKEKYYQRIEDIRRKFNLFGNQESKVGIPHEPMPRIIDKVQKKQKPFSFINRPKEKGVEYLKFSRQVGKQSASIYQKERGQIRFIKQITHHWGPQSFSFKGGSSLS